MQHLSFLFLFFSPAMATKGPVLSIEEHPAFVRSSPVLRLCKQQKMWPPGWLPRPHQSSSRDWGRYRSADQEQGSQVRSCLINLINFFEQQPCKRTRVKQETVIHPDFQAQEYSYNQQRFCGDAVGAWKVWWGSAMEAAGKLSDRDIFAHEDLVKRWPIPGTEHRLSKSLIQDTVSCLDPLKSVLSISAW